MNMPKPEFPRPEHERKNWLNLNGEWDFSLFGEGSQAREESFASSRVSYAGKIVVPFSWTSPLSRVAKNTAGIGWYRKKVKFVTLDRVYLCFGAVDYLCDVYVNGNYIGSHQGGYTYFEFDVTEAWTDGENTIEVRAEDWQRTNQTYGKQKYGNIQGIWQTVWLEARPAAFIRSMRFVTKCNGEISLTAKIDSPVSTDAELSAVFAGTKYSLRTPVSSGESEIKLDFTVKNPSLWSPDHPKLYEGTVSLATEYGCDAVDTYFGIREIGKAHFEDREYPWLTLNGKPLYINGTLDQAFNPQGFFTYPSDDEMRMEAWRLKRLGLNCARIHIKPEEPRKLYWMDRLGILIIEDMPCFWGEPDDDAVSAYESEWPDIFERDFNHPSVFMWVMFNETWGLRTDNEYLPRTQEWVADVYRRAKALDPTRIVEDNSACADDHTETDINTWHFYINGYELLKNHIDERDQLAFEGSEFNYIGGRKMGDVPLMNSECGMVWGIKNSAGDSDIAWQYHYMMNEFRLHDKICGFIFTEFHDVVNEFNGYYRIDGGDKDFGYGDFCTDMTVADLHAGDLIVTDVAPCRTVNAGEAVTTPLAISSFDDRHHGEAVSIRYTLWHEGLSGKTIDAADVVSAAISHYGVNTLSPITVKMPDENAVAVLALELLDADGYVISRNFTTFDVRAEVSVNCISIAPISGTPEGFAPVWSAQNGAKLDLGGKGEIKYFADLSMLDLQTTSSLELIFEAGAKQLLAKDIAGTGVDLSTRNLMLESSVDPGTFENSYFMTDDVRHPSLLTVSVDGEEIEKIYLEDDFADARGVLSWHYQPDDHALDEAGSYGKLCRVKIPSRLIPAMIDRGSMELCLSVTDGLAIYGRNSGRYPFDIIIQQK